MKRVAAFVIGGALGLGGAIFAVVERSKEPQLTPEQEREIRTKQVAWLRAEPGCSLLKDAVDKVAAKYAPSGYVINDGPDGLKIVKAPPPEKGKK